MNQLFVNPLIDIVDYCIHLKPVDDRFFLAYYRDI